jgi:hypothetical protein
MQGSSRKKRAAFPLVLDEEFSWGVGPGRPETSQLRRVFAAQPFGHGGTRDSGPQCVRGVMGHDD